MRVLQRADLPRLVRGYSVLGSGGGGDPSLIAMLLHSHDWPIAVHDPAELALDAPCIAVGVAGSTYLLRERLISPEDFEPLLRAAERWTGRRPQAVCSIEGAGTNGLAALMLAPDLAVVDADLMGRAFPRVDQTTLMVDQVPGLAWMCRLRDGVMIVDGGDRSAAEALVRAAIVEAGGFSTVLLAGFTVGDLLAHAVLGGVGRALVLGGDLGAEQGSAAASEGVRRLVAGRIVTIEQDPDDAFTRTVEIAGDDGAVCRVVSKSEHLVVLRDGLVDAAAPEIIVVVDANTRDILEVDSIRRARDVEVYALPADAWWSDRAHRLATVSPAAFGFAGIERP